MEAFFHFLAMWRQGAHATVSLINFIIMHGSFSHKSNAKCDTTEMIVSNQTQLFHNHKRNNCYATILLYFYGHKCPFIHTKFGTNHVIWAPQWIIRCHNEEKEQDVPSGEVITHSWFRYHCVIMSQNVPALLFICCTLVSSLPSCGSTLPPWSHV